PLGEPLNICVARPTEERKYYLVITDGMAGQAMTIPEGEKIAKYAELLLCLPSDWQLQIAPDVEPGEEDPSFEWPIACLQQVVAYVSTEATYVAPGHTVAFTDPPEPFAAATRLCALLVREPRLVPSGFETLKLGKKQLIHFYAVVPIYEDELRLHREKGPGALESLLEQHGVTELLDVQRPSVVSGIVPGG